jgi:hypothetical protein
MAGYVYILANPAFPGKLKIGSTRLHPDARARQLSTTGVPAPFQAITYAEFEDELSAERELQAIFGSQRVHPRREFYEITVEEAQNALFHLSGATHQQASFPASAITDRERRKVQRRKSQSPSNTNASVLGLPYWTRFNEFRNRSCYLDLKTPARGFYFRSRYKRSTEQGTLTRIKVR